MDSIGLFYLCNMAKCRINKIKPPCGYSVEGIARIWLLDFEDFGGYRFENNDLYSANMVTAILRSSEFTEIDAPDMVAKYSSTGAYVHSLETFVGALSAETLRNLHLGTKRRQIVLFLTNSGRYFTFGYEAGARLTYVNQTAEGLGSVVTLTASSIYPLFEASAELFNLVTPGDEWDVDFINLTYCVDNG